MDHRIRNFLFHCYSFILQNSSYFCDSPKNVCFKRTIWSECTKRSVRLRRDTCEALVIRTRQSTFANSDLQNKTDCIAVYCIFMRPFFTSECVEIIVEYTDVFLRTIKLRSSRARAHAHYANKVKKKSSNGVI